VKIPPLFLLRLTMPPQPLPLPTRLKWGVLSGASGRNKVKRLLGGMRHSRCCKKPLWRQPMLRSQLPRTYACVLRSTTATTVSASLCHMLSDPHPPSVSSVSSVSRAPRASSIAPISPVSPLSSTRLVSSATSVSPSAACLSPLLRRRFLPSPFYLPPVPPRHTSPLHASSSALLCLKIVIARAPTVSPPHE